MFIFAETSIYLHTIVNSRICQEKNRVNNVCYSCRKKTVVFSKLCQKKCQALKRRISGAIIPKKIIKILSFFFIFGKAREHIRAIYRCQIFFWQRSFYEKTEFFGNAVFTGSIDNLGEMPFKNQRRALY